MIVVTSGKRYIDVDAYAGCIAYAHLLNLKGIQAKAVSTSKFNESITESLLQLNTKLDNYQTSDIDSFVIIDISNPNFLDTIVNKDKIIEIIDHHVGYEDYWKNKLGEKVNIEFIGAVATQIVELYEKENLMHEITEDIAYLLMAAILDNTLNLKAKVTTDRDKIAYKKLANIVKDNENYSEKYFSECQATIEKDLKKSIENDTKIENIISVLPPIFAQLTIWSKENILSNKQIIYNTLNNFGDKWIINLICLKDEKSYIITSDTKNYDNLEKMLCGKFENDIMELKDVWLRKEIMKRALEEFNN